MKLFHKKLLLLNPVLISIFFSLPANAQSSCTKNMYKELTSASDQCLSDQVAQLTSKIEKRYSEIISKLPDVATPASNVENEGLSKEKMNEVYVSWKNFQLKGCLADASRYDLQKRYENRMYSICWISSAKQHLVFLR